MPILMLGRLLTIVDSLDGPGNGIIKVGGGARSPAWRRASRVESAMGKFDQTRSGSAVMVECEQIERATSVEAVARWLTASYSSSSWTGVSHHRTTSPAVFNQIKVSSSALVASIASSDFMLLTVKTALPANVNDEDIVEGQPLRPRPLSERTELSYHLSRLRFAEISQRQIWQANASPHPPYSFM